MKLPPPKSTRFCVVCEAAISLPFPTATGSDHLLYSRVRASIRDSFITREMTAFDEDLVDYPRATSENLVIVNNK